MEHRRSQVPDRTPTTMVVTAVAEREGVDPTELDRNLYEVVDTEALDALFAPTASGVPRGGRVEFEYAGYEVTVVSDGDVLVTDVRDRSPSAAGVRGETGE